MGDVVRIGSRASRLALVQAEIIREEIKKKYPEIQTEIVPIKTSGDRILNRSLTEIGGKGLFVKELEHALLEGRIDLAVHSLKDVPMEVDPALPIVAYGRREDPRDVLIYKPGTDMFPENGIVGTSSSRRILQMQTLYPGCRFRSIRGNVQTRLHKLEMEDYDGTILAAAGLRRLGMESAAGRYFSVEEMIPAAGQGILAVQGRREDSLPWLDAVKNIESEYAAQAERQFVCVLDGGCTSPTAAYASVHGMEMKLIGLYQETQTGEVRTGYLTGNVEHARQLGERLAKQVLSQTAGHAACERGEIPPLF